MRFWIDHPAAPNPVSMWRWLKYRVGDWLENIGRRMARRGLYPHSDEDDLPF